MTLNRLNHLQKPTTDCSYKLTTRICFHWQGTQFLPSTNLTHGILATHFAPGAKFSCLPGKARFEIFKCTMNNWNVNLMMDPLSVHSLRLAPVCEYWLVLGSLWGTTYLQRKIYAATNKSLSTSTDCSGMQYNWQTRTTCQYRLSISQQKSTHTSLH